MDDLIAEIHKAQSKKSSRNKNPLPEAVCILGWCHDFGGTPSSGPKAAAGAETPNGGNTSSSKTPADKCREAVDMAFEAAHDVDVGDYYFAQENYRASLFRYQDALGQKTGDAAIHVRLGRVLEKLNEIPQALEQYQAAEKLPAPEKWSKEARAAVARLDRP